MRGARRATQSRLSLDCVCVCVIEIAQQLVPYISNMDNILLNVLGTRGLTTAGRLSSASEETR